MSSLVNAAYDTSASVGRTFSYIKFISAIIFACIASIMGSSLIQLSNNGDENKSDNNQRMYAGSGLIVFGSCIVIIAFIFTYLTASFKPFAAFQGASDVVTLTKNVF